jgi:uncharacterized protein YcsI (UPF0317 family)
MTTPRFIRQIAIAVGPAWCSPALLATPAGEFDELSECLKRLPVHVTPDQVGAEGKISMTDVALFDFGGGIAGNLTYSTELLFYNRKWMYSVLRITRQNGEKLEAQGTGLFDRVCLYFEHHLGPTCQYSITSEIREDEDSGSTNRCAFWRNDLTGFVIDLDYQGSSVVALNLCVMSLDYYSDIGFLEERIRGFYNDKVFPHAGGLPAQFPTKCEPDTGKASTSNERATRRFQTAHPDAVILGNDAKSSGSGEAKPSLYGVKVWIVVGASMILFSCVVIRRCWTRNQHPNH